MRPVTNAEPMAHQNTEGILLFLLPNGTASPKYSRVNGEIDLELLISPNVSD